MGRPAVAALLFIAMSEASVNANPIRSLERFQSGGKEIRVETFGGNARRSTPSVIVLHGATGVEFANRFIANLAESIAAQGFVVHLVHYFDRTGTSYADDATIKRSSADWLQAINDATTFVQRQRPRSAIGFFGYSLGGYLAAAETVQNKNIGAAVILAGAWMKPLRARRGMILRS
jgi:carboxymethylenebutenolidase